MHPDDQVEEVRRRVKEDDVVVEREWVLPTRLKEKWSLKGFAEVFDAVGEEPPPEADGGGGGGNGGGDRDEGLENNGSGRRMSAVESKKPRRGGKRVLLATVGEDSTVVYYIMHDGIVKPRQN